MLTGNLALGANGQLHAGTQYGAFDLEIDEGSVDVAAESGQTRLLSWINDRMSVRTLPAAGEPIQTPQEGPFGAWTATAISDGPDGRSRVLWINGDGRAGLGIVGSAGSEAAFQFPATPVWSATDVAAARDGSASVLWTRASGAMYLATVDTSGVTTLGPKYGPYAGWSAIAIAEGLDGSTWVLWRSTDGRVSVARHRARVLEAAFRFDANPDWAAEDIAVAADGRPRLLRVHRDGRASLATLDAAGRLTAEQVHADGGLIPRRISAGPDGETRLLWRSAGGSEKVWLLNLDNSRKAAPTPTPRRPRRRPVPWGRLSVISTERGRGPSVGQAPTHRSGQGCSTPATMSPSASMRLAEDGSSEERSEADSAADCSPRAASIAASPSTGRGLASSPARFTRRASLSTEGRTTSRSRASFPAQNETLIAPRKERGSERPVTDP